MSLVKRSQVMQKLAAVREEMIRQDAAGGPTLFSIASDADRVFVLEQ